MDSYSTSVLAKMSGISAAQLKAWDRAELLRPERILRRRGRSTERRYTREQALGVMVLAELKRGGVKGRRVRAAASLLPRDLSKSAYVVFDGQFLYLKATAEEAIKLYSLTPEMGRVMELAPVMDRLP